jgi:hypothetical protein
MHSIGQLAGARYCVGLLQTWARQKSQPAKSVPALTAALRSTAGAAGNRSYAPLRLASATSNRPLCSERTSASGSAPRPLGCYLSGSPTGQMGRLPVRRTTGRAAQFAHLAPLERAGRCLCWPVRLPQPSEAVSTPSWPKRFLWALALQTTDARAGLYLKHDAKQILAEAGASVTTVTTQGEREANRSRLSPATS